MRWDKSWVGAFCEPIYVCGNPRLSCALRMCESYSLSGVLMFSNGCYFELSMKISGYFLIKYAGVQLHAWHALFTGKKP